MLVRTQDEGDGNLLCVSVTVNGKFLKQSLLVFSEDEPGGRITEEKTRRNLVVVSSTSTFDSVSSFQLLSSLITVFFTSLTHIFCCFNANGSVASTSFITYSLTAVNS